MDTDWADNGYIEDTDCFVGTGSKYVSIYNVHDLYTGPYTLTWDWTDCHGGKHVSSKGPETLLTPANASGSQKYAGHDVMCKITYIALS